MNNENKAENTAQNIELKNLLFPNLTRDREYFENKYPKRELDINQEVTRIAPSPTGELHAGALYMALINRTIAHKSDGVFILRIEDTDKVREVVGARDKMISFFDYFGQSPDEGMRVGGEQIGEYGPYIQSERVEIYSAFVADFVEKGFAYPCFMTREELDIMREEQQVLKVRPGVYGKYAKYQGLDFDEIKTKINNGEKYVIRLKSEGNFDNKIKFTDQIMGDMELSVNDEHFVIAKNDGVPTYHFAHLIDDYLMRITYVIRANEWVASVTKHLELWEKLGVIPPKYGHLMPINKKDGNAIRKLSKRKDPEAAVGFYIELGYPVDSLLAYLLRLANPSFDQWWHAGNRDINSYDFNIDELKRNSRGQLLDFQKLDDISSDYIASMDANEVTQNILNWSMVYDTQLYKTISKQINYLEQVLNIERGTENARKDIKKWSDARDNIFYFFDELFDDYNTNEKVTPNFLELKTKLAQILNDDKYFDNSLTLEDWILDLKQISNSLEYKKFSEFMMDIRIAITKKTKTPNMYYMFDVLGKEKVLERLEK